MLKRTSRRKMLLLVFAVVLLTVSCGLMGGSDDETEVLKQQVRALETQNAALQQNEAQQQDEAQPADEASSGVEAPPPPATEAAPEVAAVTPTPESLPTAPVPAGQPIIYDGWSMMVRKEIDIEDYSDSFGISVVVRNLGDSDRLFRYILAGVTISDDKGNIYEPTSDSLCEEHMYVPKNLNVRSDNKEEIYTAIGFRNCHQDHGLQQFQGPILLEAKQLMVHFEDFGPFSGVDVVIDL